MIREKDDGESRGISLFYKPKEFKHKKLKNIGVHSPLLMSNLINDETGSHETSKVTKEIEETPRPPSAKVNTMSHHV